MIDPNSPTFVQEVLLPAVRDASVGRMKRWYDLLETYGGALTLAHFTTEDEDGITPLWLIVQAYNYNFDLPWYFVRVCFGAELTLDDFVKAPHKGSFKGISAFELSLFSMEYFSPGDFIFSRDQFKDQIELKHFSEQNYSDLLTTALENIYTRNDEHRWNYIKISLMNKITLQDFLEPSYNGQGICPLGGIIKIAIEKNKIKYLKYIMEHFKDQLTLNHFRISKNDISDHFSTGLYFLLGMIHVSYFFEFIKKHIAELTCQDLTVEYDGVSPLSYMIQNFENSNGQKELLSLILKHSFFVLDEMNIEVFRDLYEKKSYFITVLNNYSDDRLRRNPEKAFGKLLKAAEEAEKAGFVEAYYMAAMDKAVYGSIENVNAAIENQRTLLARVSKESKNYKKAIELGVAIHQGYTIEEALKNRAFFGLKLASEEAASVLSDLAYEYINAKSVIEPAEFNALKEKCKFDKKVNSLIQINQEENDESTYAPLFGGLCQLMLITHQQGLVENVVEPMEIDEEQIVENVAEPIEIEYEQTSESDNEGKRKRKREEEPEPTLLEPISKKVKVEEIEEAEEIEETESALCQALEAAVKGNPEPWEKLEKSFYLNYFSTEDDFRTRSLSGKTAFYLVLEAAAKGYFKPWYFIENRFISKMLNDVPNNRWGNFLQWWRRGTAQPFNLNDFTAPFFNGAGEKQTPFMEAVRTLNRGFPSCWELIETLATRFSDDITLRNFLLSMKGEAGKASQSLNSVLWLHSRTHTFNKAIPWYFIKDLAKRFPDVITLKDFLIPEKENIKGTSGLSFSLKMLAQGEDDAWQFIMELAERYPDDITLKDFLIPIEERVSEGRTPLWWALRVIEEQDNVSVWQFIMKLVERYPNDISLNDFLIPVEINNVSISPLELAVSLSNTNPEVWEFIVRHFSDEFKIEHFLQVVSPQETILSISMVDLDEYDLDHPENKVINFIMRHCFFVHESMDREKLREIYEAKNHFINVLNNISSLNVEDPDNAFPTLLAAAKAAEEAGFVEAYYMAAMSSELRASKEAQLELLSHVSQESRHYHQANQMGLALSLDLLADDPTTLTLPRKYIAKKGALFLLRLEQKDGYSDLIRMYAREKGCYPVNKAKFDKMMHDNQFDEMVANLDERTLPILGGTLFKLFVLSYREQEDKPSLLHSHDRSPRHGR